MPWSIKKQDGKFCVIKDSDGSVEKCHVEREMATKHMAALYASENKEQEEDKLDTKMVYAEEVYVPWGVTSFAELETTRDADEAAREVSDLAHDLQGLLHNKVQAIVMDEEATGDRRPAILSALEDLASELAGLIEGVGNEDKQVEEDTHPIEPEVKSGWFDDLVGRVKEAIGLSEPEAAQPAKDLMLWKEKDGYHWIATYSNNYRDDDNPPEIIAAKSHKRFDELLTKGEAPMPRLWLWHVKEWEWGEATWHAYDDLGFPVAGGVVHKGCEPLAEAIAADLNKWAVSHGMPKSSIKRDPDDNSVIVEHITSEISPLPAYAAANKGTGFSIFKEVPDMAIPQDKRDQIVEGGLDPSVLDAVEAANAQRAKAEAKAGTEQKEKDQSPTDDVQPEQVDTPTEEAQEPDLRTELVEALGALNDRLGTIEANQAALAKEITALKEADATKIAKVVEETPAASLADLIRGGSAVGSEEAKIDGRTSLAKAGPEETKAQDVPQLSPVPFLNQLVAPRQ